MNVGSGATNSENYNLQAPFYINGLYAFPGYSAPANGEPQIFTASAVTSGTGWTGRAITGYTSVEAQCYGNFSSNGSLAMGFYADSTNNSTICAYSTNGTTWSAANVTSVMGQTQTPNIVNDGTTFYAIGSAANTVFTSTTGSTWTAHTNASFAGGGDGFFMGVNGIFLNITESVLQYISSNPTTGTWITSNVANVDTINSATEGNNIYLLVGTDSGIYPAAFHYP